jgi:hypothetical protein
MSCVNLTPEKAAKLGDYHCAKCTRRAKRQASTLSMTSDAPQSSPVAAVVPSATPTTPAAADPLPIPDSVPLVDPQSDSSS